MPAPCYLAKDRHGGFLFRIKIPIHLLPLFSGKKTITKSLKTYHRPTALKLARCYASQADDLFYKLEMKSKYISEQTILKARRSIERAKINDLTHNLSLDALALLQKKGADTSPELDDFIVNTESACKKTQDIEARIKELDLKIKIATDLELQNAVLSDYGMSPPVAPVTALDTNTPNNTAPSLPEAMVMYVSAKEKEGTAKKAHPDKAKHKGPSDSPYRGYTASFRLLLATAGNIRTTDLGTKDINAFKSLVSEMKNANHKEVKPLLKFDYSSHGFIKPLTEVREGLAKAETSKLAQSTIGDYFAEVSAFIGWLSLENEYLPVETCHRMQKALSPAKVPRSKAHAKEESYKSFSTEQLQTLLTHPSINPSVHYKKHPNANPFTPADFWIPLLALFTGARGRELAQLFTEDIYEKEGIWCISIQPEDAVNGANAKEVKTDSSKRLVPVSQRLIDIGLLRFLEEHKKTGEKNLFHQLRETVTGRENPYKSWGQDFRRDVLQKHLGIPTGNGEVFHSFRGTLVTELQRKGVAEDARKQLAGHSKGSDTHSRYAMGVTLATLKTLINKATYEEVDFTHISWEKYKKVRLAAECD